MQSPELTSDTPASIRMLDHRENSQNLVQRSSVSCSTAISTCIAFNINESSKQTIQQSFASIAQQIPHTELADASRSQSLSEAVIDTSVKSIIQWLLLFDNVDHEPGDESADSGSYNLGEFLPPADHGSILITSQLKSLQQYGTYLDLQTVSDDQALRILEGNSKSQIRDAHLVIEALGGLPLALTQAGAYLRSTKMPARAWAKLYEDTWKSLMKSQCRSLLQEATHGNESALTTWNMSYARVETENSDAAHLLKLWAFLDYGHLWHGLIAHAIHLESYVEVPGWLSSLANDELRFYDAIGILTRYSLVDHLETLSTYTMHPVVHKWCSQLCEENERCALYWLAAGLVAAEMHPNSSPADQDSILPREHAIHLLRPINQLPPLLTIKNKAFLQWTLHNLCRIFDNSARFEVIILKNMVFKYAAQGNPELAELSYNQARTVIECDPQILETRDPHLLYYIGQTYEAQNCLAKAEELYHQVLREIRDAPGRGKELGALYLAALHHLIELGKLHRDRGNLEKAEKLYGLVSSAVKDSPVFDEKPSVLHAAVLHNFRELGELHQDHGNLEKAEKAYGQFLSSINDAPAYEKISSALFSRALRQLIELGRLHQNHGDLDKAENIYIQVFGAVKGKTGCDKNIGWEYVEALNQLLELGGIYEVGGNAQKAKELYDQFLQAIIDAPKFEELELLRSTAEAILIESADHQAHSFGCVLCFLARVCRFVFNL